MRWRAGENKRKHLSLGLFVPLLFGESPLVPDSGIRDHAGRQRLRSEQHLHHQLEARLADPNDIIGAQLALHMDQAMRMNDKATDWCLTRWAEDATRDGLTREPFTKVPFLEPRSTSQT